VQHRASSHRRVVSLTKSKDSILSLGIGALRPGSSYHKICYLNSETRVRQLASRARSACALERGAATSDKLQVCLLYWSEDPGTPQQSCSTTRTWLWRQHTLLATHTHSRGICRTLIQHTYTTLVSSSGVCLGSFLSLLNAARLA